MSKLVRAAAYCRVSTDKADQANSLESQTRYFSEYIGTHGGWTLCGIYSDEGLSGTSTGKRVRFNEMIEDALQGRIDLILTKEVSRFARNTVDTLTYVRRLKAAGVEVRFLTDGINTFDSDAELRLTIMASLAQEESRKTSERVKWGQKRRMEQGVVFGRDLLGYRVENGKLYIIPDEAETVRLIFCKFLDEGKGAYTIAKELNESGIKPKISDKWSASSVRKILKNEKYAGDLCQKKTYTPDFLDHKKKYNHGEEDLIYIKDHHEPIVGRDVWEKTQSEFAVRSPSGETRSRYSRRYWCSGKISCGVCGEGFVSRTKKLKNGAVYKAWRCSSAACGAAENCGNVSVNEKILSAGAWCALGMTDIDRDRLAQEIIAEIKTVLCGCQKSRETGICKLKDVLRKTELKKSALIDGVLDGIITEEELKKQRVFYDEKIMSLKEKISAAEKCMAMCEDDSETEILRKAVLSALDKESPCREVCGEIVGKITVFSDRRIEIFLKDTPFGVRLEFAAEGRGEGYRVRFSGAQIIRIS